MKKIEIAIPVIVGNNGKWCALEEPDDSRDWSFMLKHLMPYIGSDVANSCSETDRRYIIRAVFEIPDDTPIEVSSASVEEVEAAGIDPSHVEDAAERAIASLAGIESRLVVLERIALVLSKGGQLTISLDDNENLVIEDESYPNMRQPK